MYFPRILLVVAVAVVSALSTFADTITSSDPRVEAPARDALGRPNSDASGNDLSGTNSVALSSYAIGAGYRDAVYNVAVDAVGAWVGSSNVDWARLSVTESEGGSELIAIYIESNQSIYPRVGIVTIGDAEIAISQSAAPRETPGFLTNRSFEFVESRGNQERMIRFYKPGDWDLSTDVDWIELSHSNGNFLWYIGFAVSPNETGALRSGTINAGGYKYRIFQLPEPNDPGLGAALHTRGDNSHGQVRASGTRLAFSERQYLMDGVSQVARTLLVALYLMESGELYAYGYHTDETIGNGEGVIGDFAFIDSNVVDIQANIMSYGWLTEDGEYWRFGGSGRSWLVAEDVVKFSEGEGGYMYLKGNGDLYGAAENGLGLDRFGTGGSPLDADTPVFIANNVIDMAVSVWDGYYIAEDHTLWASGSVLSGALKEQTNTFVEVTTGVTEVQGSGYGVFYKDTEGSLWGMGNLLNRLYHKPTSYSSPFLLSEKVQSFSVQGAFDLSHVFYRTESGEGHVFSLNNEGSFGVDGLPYGFVHESLGMGVKQFAGGESIGFTLMDSGKLFVSGRVDENAHPIVPTLPVDFADDQAEPIFEEDVKQVVAVDGAVYVVTEDDRLFALGRDWFGTFGKGLATVSATWVEIDSDVTKIATWDGYGLLTLKSDGSVWSRGDLSATDREYSRGVFNAIEPKLLYEGAVDIALGYDHIYIVDAEGVLWGLGSNSDGQIGSGASWLGISDFVQIDTGVVSVVSGPDFGLYLKKGGELFAIGSDSSGQRGNGEGDFGGDFSNLIDSSVVEIDAGDATTMYRKSDGSLWLAGLTYDNEILQFDSPTQVANGVEQFSIGARDFAYIKNTDELYGRGIFTDYGYPSGWNDGKEHLLDDGVSFVELGKKAIYYSRSSAFRIDNKSIAMGEDEFQASVAINSLTNWIAVTDVPWIDIEKGPFAQDNNRLELTVEPNLSSKSRTGIVSVMGQDILVTQVPSDYLFLSSEQIDVGPDSARATVDVRTNRIWEASSDSEWIEIQRSSSGEGDATIAVAIAANLGLVDRQATVRIGDREVIVTQLAIGEGVYFSEDSVGVQSEGARATSSESSFAGIWLPSHDDEGALIGGCVEEGLPVSFSYTLLKKSDSEFDVFAGDQWVATLGKDHSGKLSTELPCAGSMVFSRVQTSGRDSPYTGFYEVGAQDGSEGKVYVLVAPDGKTIAVAPDAIEAIATQGEMESDGTLELVEAANGMPRKSLKIAPSVEGGGFVLKAMSLDRDRVHLSSEATDFVIEVESLGEWTVEGLPSWLSANVVSGSGSGDVLFSAEANGSGLVRGWQVSIGGESLSVRQHGETVGLGFDDWLRAYYLEEEIAEMQPSATAADMDYDAFNNDDEWLLGTDPTSFASRLHLTFEEEDGRRLIRIWPADSSDFILESSADLEDWEEVGSDQSRAEDGALRYEFEPSGDAFYRVKFH